ncbi:MAG: transporter [Bacteroidia bacterium]|nr:transporter [Bacteroidia bacterium]
MKIFKGIKFDRNELSGAFGDIGTDLPLLIGVILASGIDASSALILFGLMQILTGFIYGIPMSVQPLKAFATIVIAQKLSGNVIFGGGLAIGIIMFLLTVTKILNWLSRVIPKCVVRGIQFGLGLQLSILAIKNYISSDGLDGYILAGVAFITAVVLIGNRKYPPALLIIALGIIYSIFIKHIPAHTILQSVKFNLPVFNPHFNFDDIMAGLVILALPQIPLSVGNSILATKQLANDFFPDKKISTEKIGFTYSLMNLINPFFGGFPTCHGSGGIAGHYTFGARTGGSIVILGSIFLIIGLFFAGVFQQVILIFPLPMLGVILFFESVTLISLIKDTTSSRNEFIIAVLVGLIAGSLPYGYVIGIIAGILLYYLSKKEFIGFGK